MRGRIKWEFGTDIYTLCVCAQSLQSYLTVCVPMDCSPPGSSVHGILQARILEWVAVPSSRGSSQPRGRTQVSLIAGGFFTSWATREAHTSTSISRLLQFKPMLFKGLLYFFLNWIHIIDWLCLVLPFKQAELTFLLTFCRCFGFIISIMKIAIKDKIC